MDIQQLKQAAGRAAADLVADGMRVGLGSGSTARAFVEALGERVRQGLHVTAVASSHATAEFATSAGITVAELDAPLDLAVDGADAIARGSLNAIKGLGGALVRERLVVQAASSFVLIADDSKLFDDLAESQPEIPVPVEVVPFGWLLTSQRLARFGEPRLRRDALGAPFVSDNGNLILDLFDCDLSAAEPLAAGIKAEFGVVGHGLFLGLARSAVIASPAGIQTLSRAESR